MIKCLYQIFGFFLLVVAFSLPARADENTNASEKVFSEFAVELPEGWSGDERKDFLGKKSGEYMLVLGKLDESQEKFLSQVSIYLLPNINNENARDFAGKMAEAQGGASEIGQQGNFWVFTGEPRTQSVSGRATTMVTANKDKMLIIIYQDPENLGAENVIKSLKGVTEESARLLGSKKDVASPE